MKTELSVVLDASAVLAYLQRETGFEKVSAALAEGAAISSVNLAEVLSKAAAKGKDAHAIASRLQALGLEVVAFSEEDAHGVAKLYPLTRSKGLSLGDRACLALGSRLHLGVLTADRSWTLLDLGIRIDLLR
ncbi:ribonuclease VapC [Methylomarinovum tepidoasis]|uniref:Ribonuclease VapC n=1 Tax=Methylomarinovum tepidoasis TaxID=2840183 RepID=A0AAU9BXR5_9GAMM|nr:type II toxin-antitoxin system VapC family toxin [Methylomarinovum sp. IN45]BCX88490.1 ribonuclease VapC [Methylomarinovum sp. IN45]